VGARERTKAQYTWDVGSRQRMAWSPWNPTFHGPSLPDHDESTPHDDGLPASKRPGNVGKGTATSLLGWPL